MTHKKFAAERASVECLCHERGKAKTPARGPSRLSASQRYEQGSEGSVNSSALCGFKLCWIGRRGFLLGGDAGDRFRVEAEVRVRRWLGLVDINEHRVGVVRGGVEGEVLRADVVIEEPRLFAVFSGARVDILHVGLLGAGCDRVSFSGSFFQGSWSVATPRRLISRQGKRETNGADRRSATSAPASALVSSSRLCDPQLLARKRGRNSEGLSSRRSGRRDRAVERGPFQ